MRSQSDIFRGPNLGFGEFNTADSIFEKEPEEFEPLERSHSWLAKYRVSGRPSRQGFDAIYYQNLTHMGIYSPTGSGKTFWRNTILEVSLWNHDTNIVISDRKMDSLGFLLPQDPSLMLNSRFFPDPRTGYFPIKPDCLPRHKFHLWLPATSYSFIDPLIRELMEWGVVKFFRFHPRIFVETTMGDHLPKATGMTQIESLATGQALIDARKNIDNEKKMENWDLQELKASFENQDQLTHMSKPLEKLLMLELSGIISKDSTVDLIDKTTGKHTTHDCEVLRNVDRIINSPGNLHVFCNRYMSSSAGESALSTSINYILFSLMKDACERVSNKRRVLCHLPEAENSLSRSKSQGQQGHIRRYFSDSYSDALRETRQWNLFHVLDTQQVTELPGKIPANQMTLWLMPGFKNRSELNWLQGGLGRAHLNDYRWRELFGLKNPFQSRGKAFYIGADKACKVWTRPRQTYHFREGNDPVELLSDYRKTFGLDNAEEWIRWDE
jgi:hypothetical protein